MSWVAVSAVAGALSATAGTTAAVVAATALRRNREDQARRDAAGLHASAYMAVQRYPAGSEVKPDEEPSDRTDVWLVGKVANASAHPYYAVVTSVFLKSRQRRFAAVADIVPPNTSRYARLTLVDGCDGAGMDNDTLVETTFIDSQGRGWHRDSQGLLERREVDRSWEGAELWGRKHRGVALHRMRERPETDSRGYERYVLRDADDMDVDVVSLETPYSEKDADDAAFPMPEWQPPDPVGRS